MEEKSQVSYEVPKPRIFVFGIPPVWDTHQKKKIGIKKKINRHQKEN